MRTARCSTVTGGEVFFRGECCQEEGCCPAKRVLSRGGGAVHDRTGSDIITPVSLPREHNREYRATMAEENLHHSGPVWSFDLKISTIVALFPLITLLMTPP